jgi:hypothetical protein
MVDLKDSYVDVENTKITSMDRPDTLSLAGFTSELQSLLIKYGINTISKYNNDGDNTIMKIDNRQLCLNNVRIE